MFAYNDKRKDRSNYFLTLQSLSALWCFFFKALIKSTVHLLPNTNQQTAKVID